MIGVSGAEHQLHNWKTAVADRRVARMPKHSDTKMRTEENERRQRRRMTDSPTTICLGKIIAMTK